MTFNNSIITSKINFSEQLGFFRFKKWSNSEYLLTNDVGKFVFVSDKDFGLLLEGKTDNISNKTELQEKLFIQTEKFEDEYLRIFKDRTQFVGRGPSLHMVVTTLRCNHKCRYCHAAVAPMTAKEFDMSLDTAKKVADTILYSNSKSLTVEFQGGESLVNFDIVQFIVDYMKPKADLLQKKLSFVIVTNLTLMTEEKLYWLLENEVWICTSLDGDEALHNHNRSGYKGNSFETVTYWIARINEELHARGYNRGIGALLTVTQNTLPQYEKIIDVYYKLGIRSIFLRWLNPYGFAAADMKNLAYKDDEWLSFYKKSLAYVLQMNKDGKKFRETFTGVFLQKIFCEKDPGFMDIRSPGGLGIGGIAYNYDGKVYASDESRMLGRMGIDDFFLTDLGENAELNYYNIINAKATKISIQSSTLDGIPGLNEHVYKPYIGVDILHNFTQTGNVYTPYMKDSKIQMQIKILDHIFSLLQDKEIRKILLSWISR